MKGSQTDAFTLMATCAVQRFYCRHPSPKIETNNGSTTTVGRDLHVNEDIYHNEWTIAYSQIETTENN